LAERRTDDAELVLNLVLRGAIARRVRLSRESIEKRLRFLPLLRRHVFRRERRHRIEALGIGRERLFPNHHRALVIAERLFANPRKLCEKLRAVTRRRRVTLLDVEQTHRLFEVTFFDRDLPKRRERRQMRFVEIERLFVNLLRAALVAELLFERLADAME